MTALKPETFRALLTEALDPVALAKWREVLCQEYNELYEAAHRPVVRDANRTSGGNVSDPTANVVGELITTDEGRMTPQAVMRRACEKAAVKAAEVDNTFKAIERTLTQWVGTRDRSSPLDPREKDFVEMWDHKNPGKAELEQLHEAQARRNGRGERA